MAEYELIYLAESDGTMPAEKWIRQLPRAKQEVLIADLQGVLAAVGQDVCKEPKRGKMLGDAVFEFKSRWSADEVVELFDSLGYPLPQGTGGEIMLRTFCHAYGSKCILLISGYDKGASPKSKRQNREIDKAKKLLRAWRLAQQVQAKQDARRPPTAAERATRQAQDLARTFAAWLKDFRDRLAGR